MGFEVEVNLTVNPLEVTAVLPPLSSIALNPIFSGASSLPTFGINTHPTYNTGPPIIGDVSPSKLAKTAMAKSVLDAGWADFKRMLSWKSRLRGGGMCLEVNEAYTSQVCSECGCLPASRPKGIADLGIRGWTCDECGAVHSRDTNAARNILRVGLDALAGGASHV